MNSITRFAGPYAFLSNFFICSVRYEDARYDTVEHAYQAAKTISEWHRRRIALCETPGIAKVCGRNVPMRPDWDEIKQTVMLNLLREKFGWSLLRDKLLATHDVELIEGNRWRDTYWGVCDGVGENHLGRLLMQVRHELRDGHSI